MGIHADPLESSVKHMQATGDINHYDLYCGGTEFQWSSHHEKYGSITAHALYLKP